MFINNTPIKKEAFYLTLEAKLPSIYLLSTNLQLLRQ